MSVSWKKLKVGTHELTADEIVSYVMDPQASGDYYSEAGQAYMMWHVTARAAEELGIAAPGQEPTRQEVLRTTLGQLISGVNPRTGKRIRKAGPDGTMVGALDVTMSPAPKSVSVLWALGSPRLRYELETMVAMSADRAVMRMLKEQPFVRRRIGGGPHGVVRVPAGDYVAASALHTTARISASGRGVADPQLHLHYLLIGAFDEAGQLRALDSRVLAEYQAELEAEAAGHLAELLRQRGFEVERELGERSSGQPRVLWEIKGVPASLIKAMSSRTTEIAELKKRFMAEYGREPEGQAWDAWIVKQRGPKGKLTPAELRVEWAREAAEHGFGPEDVDRLVAEAGARQTAGVPERKVGSPETVEFRELLLAHICRDYAFVPESYLDRLARQLAVALIPALQVDYVIAEMLRDRDLLVTKYDRMITTLPVVIWERRSCDAVRSLLAEPPLPGVPGAMIQSELERQAAAGRPFDEHQAAAVRLAVSGARFVSIAGPAGTGKGAASAAITALFQASAIRLFRGGGRRVIALAVPGRTAQQAGADSAADLAMTLNDLEYRVGAGRLELSTRDVLLVDEAGMIDHARYASLLESAAAAGATVVQIGDDRQLAPVGPGGLWTSTHSLANASGTAAELRVVRRARREREAEAWEAIREGRVIEGLTMIKQEGRLCLYDTREQLRAGMVAAWWGAGPERGLMMVDTSNAERDELNRLAQQQRLEAGELGSEAVRLDERRELRVGDQVLFSAIYRPKRSGADASRWVRRVENGTPAVVLAVDAERGEVELELDEPRGPRVIRVGSNAPVELGYARHVYKAQGVTVDTADMAVSLRTRLNELYVMVTRAREGARIHALAAEVEEAAAEQVELQVELEADEEAQTRPLWLQREEAERPDHLYPSERGAVEGMSGANLTAEIERARARREALEAVTIREIARHARSSTKEALGERTIDESPRLAEPRLETGMGRERDAGGNDDVRVHRGEDRWTRSPSLDARGIVRPEADRAPSQLVVRVQRAAAQPQIEAAPLPARDPVESLARSWYASHDSPKALGYLQFAGRVEYGPDPMASAVERMAADPELVMVLASDQMDRARVELEKYPELLADVDQRHRLISAATGYTERQRRREEAKPQPWLVERGAIPRAVVVADAAWASPELTRALSVAAESHLLCPPPERWLAERANAHERQMHEDQARSAEQRAAEQATRARGAARERGRATDRAAERQAGAERLG